MNLSKNEIKAREIALDIDLARKGERLTRRWVVGHVLSRQHQACISITDGSLVSLSRTRLPSSDYYENRQAVGPRNSYATIRRWQVGGRKWGGPHYVREGDEWVYGLYHAELVLSGDKIKGILKKDSGGVNLPCEGLEIEIGRVSSVSLEEDGLRVVFLPEGKECGRSWTAGIFSRGGAHRSVTSVSEFLSLRQNVKGRVLELRP